MNIRSFAQCTKYFKDTSASNVRTDSILQRSKRLQRPSTLEVVSIPKVQSDFTKHSKSGQNLPVKSPPAAHLGIEPMAFVHQCCTKFKTTSLKCFLQPGANDSSLVVITQAAMMEDVRARCL